MKENLMQKIKKLPDFEARKIAAGQVVERPANVVKELVENSIDAGASIISIYLEDAGKNLIRIIDNGCGMSQEDAQLCFENHATSKINCVADLNSLNSFGFRGEALASIAAVSQVKLVTKESDMLEGIALTLENSVIIDKQSVATQTGTELTIKNIFYNIPARLKFLKKDDTELRQIIQLFQAFCLSYQNIHFKLFGDNKLLYNCPGVNELASRVAQLWDLNLAQNLISVKNQNEDVQILGAISDHQFTRFNRNQIFFFVNGRWVKNPGLCKSLLKGYMNVLPDGKFPAAKIFINISPELIDVNIHPKKEEIQFLNPRKVETLIQETVKVALEKNLSLRLRSGQAPRSEVFFSAGSVKVAKDNKPFIAASQTTFDFEQLPFFEPVDQYNMETHPVLFPNLENNKFQEASLNNAKGPITSSLEGAKSSEGLGLKEFVGSANSNPISETMNQDSIQTDSNDFSHLQMSDKNLSKDYEIIGQYKLTYILLGKDEGLFLVDQHAAHERILYELFSKRFHEVAKVKLIFPTIITLTESNLALILPYLEILKNNGIDAECFSKNQLVINATPVHLKDVSLENLVAHLISWIEEYQTLDKNEFFKLINEKLHAQMACKAAIKAGDKLNFEQMTQLLNDLDQTDNCFSCPHGRPTGWLLPLYEIEKKFKRKI